MPDLESSKTPYNSLDANLAGNNRDSEPLIRSPKSEASVTEGSKEGGSRRLTGRSLKMLSMVRMLRNLRPQHDVPITSNPGTKEARRRSYTIDFQLEREREALEAKRRYSYSVSCQSIRGCLRPSSSSI